MELPRLEPLWQKYRDQGFQVVAVEARRDREGSLKFIEENNLTYHFLENLEGDGDLIGDMVGAEGFPTSYLIDREGRVMFSHFGFKKGDEEKIEKEIVKLL